MKRGIYILVFSIAVIAIGWLVASWIASQNEIAPIDRNPAVSVSLASSYTNAEGERWAIPDGEYDFKVSSEEAYPRFVLGSVNPVKVSLGDTQHMSVVVRDNVPLTKVWAEIENDKSTDTVPLVLGASSTVSWSDIQSQKYLVDAEGKLVINDGNNRTGVIANLIQSLVRKAEADQAVDYSYSGSWVVHDTQTITYHTTFFAEDTLGRKTQLTLAWSDPCFTGGGTITTGCSATNVVTGYDGQNLMLSGSGIAVNLAASTLVYNSGKSISGLTNGNSIVIGANSSISENNLWVIDNDGDPYPVQVGDNSLNMYYYGPSNSVLSYRNNSGSVVNTSNTGARRGSSVSGLVANGTYDCDDYNSYVKPGQTRWFTWPIADSGGTSPKNGTFDYNCDGTTNTSGWLNFGQDQAPQYPGPTAVTSYANMCICSYNNCGSIVAAPAPYNYSNWPSYDSPTICGSYLINNNQQVPSNYTLITGERADTVINTNWYEGGAYSCTTNYIQAGVPGVACH